MLDPPLDTLTWLCPATKDVIVQMFEWTWDSVTGECFDFLGPAGYGFVQCKPPSALMTSLLTSPSESCAGARPGF